VIDFLGIGAQKSATSWLFTQLRAHPDVRFPAGKEVHFWDRQYRRGVAWWLGRFPDQPAPVRQGEITPAYAVLPVGRIGEVRAAAPDLRIVYSVRNPMARAWSAATMLLPWADMAMAEASDQWFLDHFRSEGSRRRGAYCDCLDRWTSVFGGEQVAVIVFDDIVCDPRSVLVGLAGHLGIDAAFFERRPDTEVRAAVFEGAHLRVRPTLLEALRAQYGAEIDRLGERLGRDLSAWKEWDGS
jgi:hypothetical protein